MQPGVLAVSFRSGVCTPGSVVSALEAVGVSAPVVDEGARLVVAAWGGLALGADGHLALSRGARRHEADLSDDEASSLLAAGAAGDLATVLPPFAAFRRVGADEAVAVTDALGFRHLYHARWSGAAAFSTSARALAQLAGRGVDHDALAVQSLLGWQVGQWTVYDGVLKLGPGELVRLRAGHLDIEDGRPPSPPPAIGLDEAVDTATRLLRDHLTTYVTDHPGATIQLTGGQDSRILLSAIPAELRRGMTALTLAVPGSPDVDIAAAIAARTGARHRVEALRSLELMAVDEAYQLCVDSSEALEGMADPLALAALTVVERSFDQGHRIAGLGGEVARGFYYLGSPRQTAVTRSRVARLAAWRMFANEAVDPESLAGSLRAGAHDLAVDRIHDLLVATGKDWLAATDDFYLDQRMQRWAGITDTAVCLDRSVVNPMLDDRFIAIAQGMTPRSKRGSLFLARLQMSLDPELGRVALDGRPAPEAYARPGALNRVRAAQTLGRKAVRKVRQRAGHSTRPPAGGDLLAEKVIAQWRRSPVLLDRAREHGVLDEAWLDSLVAGELTASPGTVAFVLNVASMPVTRHP